MSHAPALFRRRRRPAALSLATLVLCGALAGRGAPARATPTGTADPGLACRRAIRAAELGGAIPPQLLAAIGRVESGRRDAATGGLSPWPWTINAEGAGRFFDSKAEAIAAVRELQARGVRSIDVGCLQVNLMHHPDAFASLDQAFDPQANAFYAAAFLKQLHGQTGSWPKAAAAYHSQTPELAEAYQQQVMAAWPEERQSAGTALGGGMPMTMPVPMAGPFGRSMFASVPGGGMGPMILPGAPHAHVLPMVAPQGAGGGAAMTLGRDLAAYRRMPIAMAPHAGG
jgi:hypothetical protein